MCCFYLFFILLVIVCLFFRKTYLFVFYFIFFSTQIGLEPFSQGFLLIEKVKKEKNNKNKNILTDEEVKLQLTMWSSSKYPGQKNPEEFFFNLPPKHF